MARVVDARAARGAGGFEKPTWGITEVMGATRGVAEVGEASDEGATYNTPCL
jgi:hypothetical protein